MVAFDQRGWGKTACDEENRSPDAAYGLTNRKHQLTDLEFFLKKEMARVGPKRPIFLFGHSMVRVAPLLTERGALKSNSAGTCCADRREADSSLASALLRTASPRRPLSAA